VIGTNFLQENVRLHRIEKLLLYNLTNTERSPTSIAKNTISLIDVIKTNKDYHEKLSTVVDLGCSDHKA
jgi:hypothetical protein